MDDAKKLGRTVENKSHEVGRELDGHDVGDDIGNAGDDLRAGLGNAGDTMRREADHATEDAERVTSNR
jgi:hypothetical protein